MTELVEELLAILLLFWNFAIDMLVPAAVADITLVHVVVWVVIFFGILTTAFTTIKGMTRARK